MSFIVIIYDGNYPDSPGSSCDLLGSYHTRDAARFISEVHKRRNKLDFYPRILEVAVPADEPEASILEENLKIQKSKEENGTKTNYKIKKLRESHH